MQKKSTNVSPRSSLQNRKRKRKPSKSPDRGGFFSLRNSSSLPWGDGRVDRLVIRADRINRGFIQKFCIPVTLKDKRPQHFKSSQRYSYRNVTFLIQSSPIAKNPKSRYAIDVNPSHFPSYRAFCRFCRKLLPKDQVMQITRIDFAVLLERDFFPVELFFLTGYVPRKQRTASYYRNEVNCLLGQITGVSFGHRPHRLTCYDTDSKSRRGQTNPYPGMTNVEVQISHARCKHLKIVEPWDLDKLVGFDPFEGVLFYDVFSLPVKAQERALKRAKSFRRKAFSVGYNNARATFSKSKAAGRHPSLFPVKQTSNFNRDYTGLFAELQITPQITLSRFLLQSFRRGIKAWLSDG